MLVPAMEFAGPVQSKTVGSRIQKVLRILRQWQQREFVCYESPVIDSAWHIVGSNAILLDEFKNLGILVPSNFLARTALTPLSTSVVCSTALRRENSVYSFFFFLMMYVSMIETSTD